MTLDLFSDIYKGKKVLVTGDTGFKGSWLCIWLKELGAEVYGYALPPLTPQDTFVTTKLQHKIHHKDGDVRDRQALQDYFSEVQPEIAFHLAAQPLVIESYHNPYYNFETNLMGTVNFFEAVRHCPSVKAAINITTDKCYQNNEWVWGYRENDPMGGDDPYSASKGCSELITHSYLKSFFTKDHTAHIASARAGNVIGGGDWAADRLLPDFLRALDAGRELVIRSPAATRPWQHVLEPLAGYLILAERLVTRGKEIAEAWNFGPNEVDARPVRWIVETLCARIQSAAWRLDDAPQPHEAGSLKLDSAKAKAILGWAPRWTLAQALEMTVNWHLAWKAASDMAAFSLAQIHAYESAGLPA